MDRSVLPRSSFFFFLFSSALEYSSTGASPLPIPVQALRTAEDSIGGTRWLVGRGKRKERKEWVGDIMIIILYALEDERDGLFPFSSRNQTVMVPFFFSCYQQKMDSRRNLPWFHEIRRIPRFPSLPCG